MPLPQVPAHPAGRMATGIGRVVMTMVVMVVMVV